MLVRKNLSQEIPGTNTYYFNMEREEPACDAAMLYGYDNLFNDNLFNDIKDLERKIYFNVTMPTEFCSPQDINLDNKFDEVYTICPYSVDWLNEVKGGRPKYRAVCYPVDYRYKRKLNKEYDVCYHGGIHGAKYVEMLDILKNFDYRYMSMTRSINDSTKNCLGKYATNIDLDWEDKLDLIAKAKISVCYNNFSVRGGSDLSNIKRQPNWTKNQAFSHAETDNLVPQFKSRFMEAAMCGTLNLVERDPWNVVEKWFRPDEHFIYFDSNDNLQDKIEEILNNWENYQHIITNASKYASKYSCESTLRHIEANGEGTSK